MKLNQNIVFVGSDSHFTHNLLREIFSSHEEILCPPPLHLIADQALAYSNFVTAESFLKEYLLSDNDRDSLFAQLITMAPQSLLRQRSAKCLMETSPENRNYFSLIGEILPDCRRVFLIRDGRDVVASLISCEQVSWLPQNQDRREKIQALANYWLDCIYQGLSDLSSRGIHDNPVSVVFYEDLFSDSTFLTTIGSLLPMENPCLNPETLPVANTLISNEIIQPGLWRGAFTSDEISLLKISLQEVLESLGYLNRDPF